KVNCSPIPNSIHFFLTNTLSNDNLDQCLRTANGEIFWNGKECELAFGFGSKCRNHEQCQIITQYTFCIELGGHNVEIILIINHKIRFLYKQDNPKL
ncbi:hypothetical protein BpHYR1_013480, partial [Brachionus plicatilis]